MRPARLSIYQSPRNPTPREREILTLIAEGRTQKQAARTLGLAHVSSRTYLSPTDSAACELATPPTRMKP
jgi:DNA-binding NarL/FixJ family response regulator